MGRNLTDYVTIDIRKIAPLPVSALLLPLLKNVSSTMEHQIENSKLGLITIPDYLGTKDIQLILNFPNTSGK